MENAVADMQRLIATRLQRAAASARISNAPAMDVKTQVDVDIVGGGLDDRCRDAAAILQFNGFGAGPATQGERHEYEG